MKENSPPILRLSKRSHAIILNFFVTYRRRNVISVSVVEVWIVRRIKYSLEAKFKFRDRISIKFVFSSIQVFCLRFSVIRLECKVSLKNVPIQAYIYTNKPIHTMSGLRADNAKVFSEIDEWLYCSGSVSDWAFSQIYTAILYAVCLDAWRRLNWTVDCIFSLLKHRMTMSVTTFLLQLHADFCCVYFFLSYHHHRRRCQHHQYCCCYSDWCQ